MRHLLFLILPVIFASGCKQQENYSRLLKPIEDHIVAGNLSQATMLADSVRKANSKNLRIFLAADSLSQIAERIKLDFGSTPAETFAEIEKRTGPFTPEDKAYWEKRGWLEGRMIDGQMMYFNRAASNLVLLRIFHEQMEDSLSKIGVDPDMKFRRINTQRAIQLFESQSLPVLPVKMKISYTLTVQPDAVPDGETIRCWLPWPKQNKKRQKNVRLLSTSHADYTIAPDSAIHSTIYMEEAAVKGKPAIFRVSFSYESSAQYFDPVSISSLPYDKGSAIFNKYTLEQPPHINFSHGVRRLADSIAGDENNSVETVRKIYHWFKENIPWAGALEYSIIPDIPGYVCVNRRGDCGMQTFLFMSMLRYRGIPVRWLSGWKVPPGDKNLHDWCEVYYEGTGWVPVDVSYDLQSSEDIRVSEYFMSGIDSYRLIINDGIAGPLYPEKLYLRSEPYDFQRGEVEWKGGNLYFNKWDYNMRIEYLD
jgi:transglutaminase-like putative cysteine protease